MPTPTDSAAPLNSPEAASLHLGDYCVVQTLPRSSAQTGPGQELTRPAWPKAAWDPLWTLWSPWHLHQYQLAISTRRRD